MWPFRGKGREKPSVVQSDTPSGLIFQNYILDVIGYLSKERSEQLQRDNIQKTFKSKASEWHEVIREVLGLSDTIDIAILDLWYSERENASKQGKDLNAGEFARDFVNRWVAEGSTIDVWPEGALEAAKRKIEQYKSRPQVWHHRPGIRYHEYSKKWKQRYGKTSLGYVKDIKLNPEWQEMGLLCQWEHCIESSPAPNSKATECSMFGHFCASGEKQVEQCRKDLPEMWEKAKVRNEALQKISKPKKFGWYITTDW